MLLSTVISFLSHLLKAGCDKGVQRPVRPSVLACVRVRPSICLSTIHVEYKFNVCFFVPVIARIMKHCIAIVLGIPLKAHFYPVVKY